MTARTVFALRARGISRGLRAVLLPVLQRAQVHADQFLELALADLSNFADGATGFLGL